MQEYKHWFWKKQQDRNQLPTNKPPVSFSAELFAVIHCGEWAAENPRRETEFFQR